MSCEDGHITIGWLRPSDTYKRTLPEQPTHQVPVLKQPIKFSQRYDYVKLEKKVSSYNFC